VGVQRHGRWGRDNGEKNGHKARVEGEEKDTGGDTNTCRELTKKNRAEIGGRKNSIGGSGVPARGKPGRERLGK